MSLALLGAGPGTDSAALWTPASLSPDFWIEAADTAHIYTDLGSTPVTTDGQAVEQWNDKSGNARNVTQAVSASRPLYKTDLTKPSLLFDGVNSQFLQSASSLTWTDGSGQHWFAISAQTAGGAKELATIKQGSYLADLYADTSLHTEIFNAASAFQEATKTGVVANTPFVAIGTIATGAITSYVDNVAGTPNSSPGTLLTSTSTMLVGGTNNFGGRIFGLVHGQGTLSSTDRANLQTYMAALHP